jgi:hypothetical protein
MTRSCPACGKEADLFLRFYEVASGTAAEYLCKECYEEYEGRPVAEAQRGISVDGHIWITDYDEPGGKRWIT